MKRSSDKRFFCKSCGIDTSTKNKGIAEYYMVEDDVWESAGMTIDGGMLCIGCIEDRLGRKLTPSDFTDCLLNTEGIFPKSDRLKERLGLC